MLWNRNVVSALSSRSSQPQVVSCLSSLLVTELAELVGKIIAAQVAGQLHTAMISSRTKWSRMSLGRSPSSKWHSVASRTAERSSSRLSASVKIGADKAFAS